MTFEQKTFSKLLEFIKSDKDLLPLIQFKFEHGSDGALAFSASDDSSFEYSLVNYARCPAYSYDSSKDEYVARDTFTPSDQLATVAIIQYTDDRNELDVQLFNLSNIKAWSVGLVSGYDASTDAALQLARLINDAIDWVISHQGGAHVH